MATTTSSRKEIVNNDVDRTRLLLVCGVVAGPLFIGVSLIQALTRQGFDLTRHAISLLLLGNLGWIQFTNFLGTGLLAVAAAIGMWRLLHPGQGGTWGSLLVGVYGVGLITAGVFTPDPQFGFPPGSPEGISSAGSGHATLHYLAFFALVLSLVAACFVFARRFASLRQWGWVAYCVATGLGAPALLILGIGLSSSASGGLPLLGVATTTSAWLTIVSMQLLAEYRVGLGRSR